MSNTRKITASKKNRSLKGVRAVFRGSNPHSKGDNFSRSWVERTERVQARRKVRGGRRKAMVRMRERRFMEALVEALIVALQATGVIGPGYKGRGAHFRCQGSMCVVHYLIGH